LFKTEDTVSVSKGSWDSLKPGKKKKNWAPFKTRALQATHDAIAKLDAEAVAAEETAMLEQEAVIEEETRVRAMPPGEAKSFKMKALKIAKRNVRTKVAEAEAMRDDAEEAAMALENPVGEGEPKDINVGGGDLEDLEDLDELEDKLEQELKAGASKMLMEQWKMIMRAGGLQDRVDSWRRQSRDTERTESPVPRKSGWQGVKNSHTARGKFMAKASSERTSLKASEKAEAEAESRMVSDEAPAPDKKTSMFGGFKNKALHASRDKAAKLAQDVAVAGAVTEDGTVVPPANKSSWQHNTDDGSKTVFALSEEQTELLTNAFHLMDKTGAGEIVRDDLEEAVTHKRGRSTLILKSLRVSATCPSQQSMCWNYCQF